MTVTTGHRDLPDAERMSSLPPLPRALPSPAPALVRRRLGIGLLAAAVVLGIAGCDQIPQAAPNPTQGAAEKIAGKNVPAENSSPDAKATKSAPATRKRPPSPAPPGDENVSWLLEPQEYWELHSMRGSRVGHAHYLTEEVTEDGRQLLRTSAVSEASVQRAQDAIRQVITLKSWDTPTGEMVRFETALTAAGQAMETAGRVVGEELVIEVKTLGKSRQAKMPWKKEYRGLFGVEQTLRAIPLEAGETRTVINFLPIMNVLGENRLTAREVEEVELLGNQQKLLRIDAVTIIPAGDPQGQRIESTVWVDEEGEPLKNYVAGVGQTTVRATKDQALADDKSPPTLDLIEESVVRVEPPLKNSLETTRVVYRARVKEGRIAGLFAEGISQQVKLIDDRTAEVEVVAVGPNTPLPAFSPAPPTAGDTAPNSLIQSDDPRVARLAQAAGRVADPFKSASALEALIHRSIQQKNFSQAFASAAEVARSLEGDCTEHAVLLAAVCRARKLPARTAIGLVYYPPQQGFAYHMWNEVWIGDRWLPFDATLGRGGIGADHLKLVDTNLQGASAYSAMLPVVQAFGRLELKVLSAE